MYPVSPRLRIHRSSSALQGLLSCLLLALLGCSVAAQTKGVKPAAPAAKPADDLDLLLKADEPVGTLFRLVDAADPKQALEPRLFWHRIPAFASVSTTPVRVSVGGDDVIAPKQITGDALTELNFTYPIEGRRKLEPGRYVITPGDIPLVLDAGRYKSDHPAVLVNGDEVQIRCAPVRFDGVNEAGAPAPVRVEVAYGKTALLRERAAFSPLVVWLPVGVRYISTLGNFTLSAQGKLENVSPEPGVTVTPEGLRLLVKSPASVTAAAPAAGGPWLMSHRGRAVFTPSEEPVFTALVARGFAGGEAKIMVALGQGEGARTVQVGTLPLPAVAQTAYDSRAFTLHTASLPIGEHQLWIETPSGASAKIPVSIVSWENRSSFFTETTSHCTGQWPANDAGLQMLADAGVQMVASSGFHSVLDTAMPTLAPASAGPAELGLKRAENDLLLERLLRHGLRSVDLTPMRGQVMYLESLSYHHSYQPTVDRMVRKMQEYTQQTADYPSAWGVNYSWFPQLGGYAEGGVPTDAHVADRNRVLKENLEQAGFVALTKEERALQAANKFSTDSAARAQALELQRRGVAYWKAQQDFGWGRHNKLYNDAAREVRPDTTCLLLENAGHDALKRTRSIFGDMAASFYGSYTDFGDWPMSAAFTTDWARGNAPGRPVWITTCWGTTPEGMTKSLLHAFSRGANGGGVPMQEDAGMAVLARRAKAMAFVTQFGAIATKATPDQRFAILSTASEQVFAKDQAQYVYHALYMHLTRLGCAPIIVDDVAAVEKGIPAPVKVLFLARQQQPLEPELADAIAAYQKRGGKVVTTADCLAEVPGAVKLDQPVKQLWELGGFTADSHANVRKEFEEHIRGPLAAALAQTGVAPLATTDVDRAIVNSLEAGPVRYAVVIADSKGKHSNIFEPTPALPVSLEGTGWAVRDLVKQTTLPTTTKNGRTEVSVDLVTEPVTVLALYQKPPTAVVAVMAPSGSTTFAVEARVEAADHSDLGPVPVRIDLRDPAGHLHSTLFRAAGEEAAFHLGTLATAGRWKVTAQEQLCGVTVEADLQVPIAPEHLLDQRAATPVADVHVINEEHARAFAHRTGEKLVILEAGQETLLPVAQNLVARLNASGQHARLWQVHPQDFDTIPVRWYPQPDDVTRLQSVSTGQLIGWRGNLTPFIDKAQRVHVPQRGGYAEDGPFFMVGEDAIVFSGGQLAESLRTVTPWMDTPNAPGRGQSRVVVCFSPFAAGRQVAALVGHDVEGFQKAGEQLVALTTKPALALFGATSVTKGLAQRSAQKISTTPVATPLRDFTPTQRTLRLLANPRGQAALFLEGKADTLALVDEQGQVTGTVAAEPSVLSQARMDQNGRLWTLTARGIGQDKAWHFDNAHELTLRSLAPDGATESEAIAYSGETHDLPPDHQGGVRVAPDGKTFAFGRRAEVLLGTLAPAAAPAAMYNDLPFVKTRFEVRNPRFPVGTTFSPDSKYAFFTMDTRPRFGGMGVTSLSPIGCEATLVEVQTGKRVWGLRALEKSAAFAALSGFAAVSKDGAFTALADYEGSILLVDKAGKLVLRESVATAPAKDETRLGPPGGVGVWISENGSVAAWVFRNALHIARDGKLVQAAPAASFVSGGVSADGSLVFAGSEDGEVIALGADGTKRWSFQSGGPNPQLGTIRAHELLVANNAGELIHLDAAGQEVHRVNLAAAADKEKHAPHKAANFQQYPTPLEPHDPGTLALAQAQLGAKQIAAWKPAGQGTPAFGREFFPAASPIELSAPAADGDCFVHLVYRRAESSRETTVTTTGADGTEKFLLDLPTPQFRVVDLPVRGPGVKVSVAGGGLEVAECSLWSFHWPGANKLYVAPAGGALASTGPKSAKGAGDLNLDDLLEGGTASTGKAKEAKIYVFNADPDQVKGPYLKPASDPMIALDGRRFGNGKLPDWVGGKPNYKGAWLTVDLGKPAPVRFVATYERVNRQSEVTANFAVFSGFDEKLNESGDLLAAAVGSDQFWRVFPVTSPKTVVLGVHCFGGATRPEGLSEVEAY
ncbi:MAG TPA: hypothetical protein VGO11_04260 [Chthoniobacteraceae bacterium]|nr:hypothetical protein [Chthoniobacteraceae bacterium]